MAKKKEKTNGLPETLEEALAQGYVWDRGYGFQPNFKGGLGNLEHVEITFPFAKRRDIGGPPDESRIYITGRGRLKFGRPSATR